MAANQVWVWIDPSVILAVHEEQLAEHGGAAGVRDAGLPESALARPRVLALDAEPSVCELAAAYGFGLARNHPFIDGRSPRGLKFWRQCAISFMTRRPFPCCEKLLKRSMDAAA